MVGSIIDHDINKNKRKVESTERTPKNKAETVAILQALWTTFGRATCDKEETISVGLSCGYAAYTRSTNRILQRFLFEWFWLQSRKPTLCREFCGPS